MASTTTSKSGSGSVLGWLLLLLLLLLLLTAMAGGVGSGLDLSRRESKGGAASSTPCPPGKDPDEEVRTFRAKGLGEVDLLCGDRESGYRHIARRHSPVTSRMYGCIRRVLANATPVKRADGQWLYHMRLHGGDWAEVWVKPGPPGSRRINSAYTKGFGESSARWADCMSRRIG